MEFIIIGGIAATLHGSRFTTDDVDILIRHNRRNLDRLTAVLSGLDAKDSRRRTLETVMADLGQGGTARLRTRYGGLDIMAEVPAEGDFGFQALARRADPVRIGAHEVRVAALADLIEMKEKAHRVRDLARLPELRRISELETQRRRRRSN